MIGGIQLDAYARTVGEFTRNILAEELPRHPLTFGAATLPAGTRRVQVDADVRVGRVNATYPVPVFATSILQRLDPTLGSLDQLVITASEVIRRALDTYERHLLGRLTAAKHGPFIGLAGYLPPSVGTGVIGGIDERQHPGWQSQVHQRRGSIVKSVLSLEARCTTGLQPPDLMVLGKNKYEELLIQIEPQQRFRAVQRGVAVLRLNRSGVYHDPFADPDAAYILHADDFRLYVGVPVVDVAVTPEGLWLRVKRAEQLTSMRRFRSGRIVERQAA